jgi:hypothetical protein
MSAHAPFEICEHCSLRVGTYEAALIQLADGTIITGSILGIGETLRHEVRRVWHRTCVNGETRGAV